MSNKLLTTFNHVKEGDIVTRLVARSMPMELKVSEVDDEFIYCGAKDAGWKFRRDTGGEVDEELDWDGVVHWIMFSVVALWLG